MTISREEVFGPCAVISCFRTEDEAVEKANDTTYGLAAALFTENLKKAHRVAARVQAGTVWVIPLIPSYPNSRQYFANTSNVDQQLAGHSLRYSLWRLQAVWYW